MHVRRRVALLGAALLLVAATGPAAGQDEAAPVPYLDAQGNQLGTILIREFADPFTEFDPAVPPAEGQRYVMLTATFEAAEDQSFPTDPYQVQLLDSNGYLYYSTWVPRPADATVPDLQSQNLAPFDRVSGVIPYVLPADASIVRIVYRGDGSRLMTLADLGDAGAVARRRAARPSTTRRARRWAASRSGRSWIPSPSSTRPRRRPRASATSASTWPSRPPRTRRSGPTRAASWSSARDGVMYSPTWVPRPQPYLLQDVESTPLSPSDRVSGFVGYLLPEGVSVDAVVYNSDYDRYLPVADL